MGKEAGEALDKGHEGKKPDSLDIWNKEEEDIWKEAENQERSRLKRMPTKILIVSFTALPILIAITKATRSEAMACIAVADMITIFVSYILYVLYVT